MKIANIITFTTGSYQNKTMLVRPYRLTLEGARRILQASAADRFEDEPCTVTVCVTNINTMIVTQ